MFDDFYRRLAIIITAWLLLAVLGGVLASCTTSNVYVGNEKGRAGKRIHAEAEIKTEAEIVGVKHHVGDELK